MTPEEKELLLKDLCARLPYKPQIKFSVTDVEGYEVCELLPEIITSMFFNEDIEIKPYLRPMLSMTEEEHRELSRLVNDDNLLTGDPAKTICLHCGVVIDFHNSHHIDWRCLIPKGLALVAPEGMYKKGE